MESHDAALPTAPHAALGTVADVPASSRVIDSESAKPAPARVAVEDVILYLFAIAFMLMFWLMFERIRQSDQAGAMWVSAALTSWKPAAGDDRDVLYYKSQLALSGLRYQQADRATTGIAARRNFGFLVGSIIALLGAVVAIRGTRADVRLGVDSTKSINTNISTTSAGAFIIFVGGAIIMATLLGEDRAMVTDDGIDYGSVMSTTVPNSPSDVPVDDATASDLLRKFDNGRKN